MMILDSNLYDKVYWINEKYRCCYCSIEMYNKDKMTKHEQSCEYNPENKNCITCDSQCKIQPGGGYGCREWKNKKFERTKKLNTLKNKLNLNGIHRVS